MLKLKTLLGVGVGVVSLGCAAYFGKAQFQSFLQSKFGPAIGGHTAVAPANSNASNIYQADLGNGPELGSRTRQNISPGADINVGNR